MATKKVLNFGSGPAKLPQPVSFFLHFFFVYKCINFPAVFSRPVCPSAL